MKDTRLIQLLSSFSPKEIKLFSDFVHSPYFNKNEKVMLLTDTLLRYYPDYDKKMPGEEKLFASAFKNEAYDYFKLRNYTSDILELALLFLKTEKLRGKTIFGNILLLESLREHKQEKIYEKELQRAVKNILPIAQSDGLTFLENYLLKKEESIYFTLADPNTHHELTQYAFDAFLEFVLLQILDYYGLMLHEQMQNNVPYAFHLYDEILQYCEKNYSTLNISIKVYIDMLRLVNDLTNKNNYDNLKMMLQNNYDKIPFEALTRGYIHLIDFCAYQINKLGNNDYVNEVHGINKDLFKYHIQTPKTLVYMDFLNIVKMAATAKDFDWLDTFMKDYLPYMPKEEQENCENFSKAFISNYKNAFGDAAKYMSAVNFKNHILKIQVKQFTIRFLYEEELFDQILSQLEAFTHYLKREAMLPEEMIAGHEKFIIYVRELIKLNLVFDKKEKTKRKADLTILVSEMESNYFGTRNWLKKKLDGVSV